MALSRLYFITREGPGVAANDGGVIMEGPGVAMDERTTMQGPGVAMVAPEMGVLEQVQAACRAGIRMIQLRMKEASDTEFRHAAAAAKRICDAHGCLLIINDRVEVAAAVDAAGVHVGKEDMPVGEARRILGPAKIIGGTANTPEDAVQHCRGGADYIGLGPYRHTTTKKKLSPILGIGGYGRVIRALTEEGSGVPVYAIGGIGKEDLAGLLDAGVYGIAFSGLLVRAGDREGLVKDLEDILSNTTIKQC